MARAQDHVQLTTQLRYQECFGTKKKSESEFEISVFYL